MTNDDWDPYATEELPVVGGHEAPTEPIPAVGATPLPPMPQQPPAPTPHVVPAVERTAEQPPWREGRPFPWGATVRRVILRFLFALAALVVASLWSQLIILAENSPTGPDEFVVPPVEPVAIWAALYTLVTVIVDLCAWWAIPWATKLPSRMLARWALLAVIIIRPIHARAEDIEAIINTASWMIVAYAVAMAITVAVLRWLPGAHRQPMVSGRAAAVLVGTTAGMMTILPFTHGDFPASGAIRPVYEWAFSWLDPGLGDGTVPLWFVAAAFAVALIVFVFDRQWGGLGRFVSYLPLIVTLVLFATLFALAPWPTVAGAAVGLPLWAILLLARGPRVQVPR